MSRYLFNATSIPMWVGLAVALTAAVWSVVRSLGGKRSPLVSWLTGPSVLLLLALSPVVLLESRLAFSQRSLVDPDNGVRLAARLLELDTWNLTLGLAAAACLCSVAAAAYFPRCRGRDDDSNGNGWVIAALGATAAGGGLVLAWPSIQFGTGRVAAVCLALVVLGVTVGLTRAVRTNAERSTMLGIAAIGGFGLASVAVAIQLLRPMSWLGWLYFSFPANRLRALEHLAAIERFEAWSADLIFGSLGAVAILTVTALIATKPRAPHPKSKRWSSLAASLLIAVAPLSYLGFESVHSPYRELLSAPAVPAMLRDGAPVLPLSSRGSATLDHVTAEVTKDEVRIHERFDGRPLLPGVPDVVRGRTAVKLGTDETDSRLSDGLREAFDIRREAPLGRKYPDLTIASDRDVSSTTVVGVARAAQPHNRRPDFDLLVEVTGWGWPEADDGKPRRFGTIDIYVANDDERARFVVDAKGDGLQIRIDGQAVPPVDGCPREGPTLCSTEGEYPWHELYNIALRHHQHHGDDDTVGIVVSDRMPIGTVVRIADVVKLQRVGGELSASEFETSDLKKERYRHSGLLPDVVLLSSETEP